MPTRIRIGVAGWSIATRQRALFGDGDSGLARYATRFDCTEINSSFYRPHRLETYARWAASVPRGFRFSVKLPRAITHEARLRGAGPALSRFADEVAGLGAKLGVLLVQLPPGLPFDARVAQAFFAALRRRFPRVVVACEPRHASWFAPRVDGLWARHAVTRVAADPPPVPAATAPGGERRWAYWRWHGSPDLYASAYDDARLADLALRLRGPATATHWCIFDNTARGHAIDDALRLRA